jgi:gamma-glutamyltranspeptidase/glutathione hydrolase
MQASASGPAWAIASPHHDATAAGAAAFERGGNAVDAALAAATTIAVTAPSSCGVGGDLFALVQRPDGEMLSVSSSGRAPLAADPAAVARDHDAMPLRGPIPITVPGAVAGWRATYDLGAILPWEDAFGRAIELASDGMRVSHGLAETLAEPDAAFASDPGLSTIFFAGGVPAAAGATITQFALGRTLEAIAGGGPDALYRGEVGRIYVRGLQEAGSPITVEDLEAHRALVLPPIRAAYRDLHVSVAPPNSQGFVLLEILSLLDRLGIDPDPHGPGAGTVARVFAAASADRDRHLADPDRMIVHPSTLLDDGHLAGLADDLRAQHPPDGPHDKPDGDTIAIVTADAEGFAVSLIQSLYWGFGSGICEPATGIVAHNRGACFTLEAGHPNAFAPGMRPAHTLTPVIVHGRLGLAAVAGTMGGYAQPQINAQTLLRLVGGAAPAPADAVAAPRWIVERAADAAGPLVSAETSVPAPARTSIEASGFALADVPDLSSEVGHAQLIRVGPGRFDVGSDPRSDGGGAAG